MTEKNESHGKLRVTEEDAVWWLLNPQGERFVSIGANHLQSDCWLAPYNRDEMLARYGQDLATDQDLFNPQGQALPRLVSSVLTQLQELGFNSLGLHTYDVPASFYGEQMYYLRAIELVPLGSRFRFGEQRFPDIFSEEFESELDAHLSRLTATHAPQARFMGYAFSDIPRWYFFGNGGRGSYRVHPWVLDLFNQDKQSAGYQAAMQALGHDQPSTEEDSDRVMQVMVRRWYELHCRLIRKHDPGRLIFGDKLHSPHLVPDWFLDLLKECVDVVLIQWYTPIEDQRETLLRIHQHTGKPILNGDSCFGHAKAPKQSKVKGYAVASQEEVGLHYAAYLDALMELPFMLGWHHCGILEQWDGGKRRDWEINENGFMDPFGKLYEEICGPMQGANLRSHQIHQHSGS